MIVVFSILLNLIRVCVCVCVFGGFFLGKKETECEATEELTLKCNFPKNMESTETDFLIYFYPDDGKTGELYLCDQLSIVINKINYNCFV